MVGRQGPNEGVTVVLVDDEPLVRMALAQALAAGGIELVGEATSGQVAVKTVVELRPDVVVIDVRLAGMSGLETIRQLARLAPASRVLVLTRTEERSVVEAIVAGAGGYILKDATPDEIVLAVRATAAGESVISPRIAGELLRRIRQSGLPVATGESAADAIRATLTARELEVFRRLASGQSNLEIGRELSLSTNTIANHVASILAKLQLDNRVQAAVQAVRSGMS
jgi:DNA-binding NarL/FixJ family response regulator